MGLESLYDRYRTDNSNLVPQYEGSTGAATLKVADLKQGIYDAAQSTAGEVGSMAQNAISMQHSGDIALKNELVGQVNDNIKKYSAQGDWENHLEDVRSMGRNYVQRAKELAAPVEQYNTWVKDELTKESKKLTPDQMNTLQASRLSQYQGLKKDATGKFVGSFNGGQVANNVDTVEFADKALKDRIVSQGGSEISNDNGYYKWKQGNTYHTFTPKQVLEVTRSAREASNEYQAFANQEGEMNSFKNRGRVRSVDDLSDTGKAAFMENLKQGFSPSEAVNQLFTGSRKKELADQMDRYALSKYVQNDHTSVRDSAVGDVTKSKLIKELDDPKQTATVTMANIGNPAQAFADMQTKESAANKNVEESSDNIDKVKNIVAREYKIEGGASHVSEDQINKYFDSLGSAGKTLRAELKANRESYGKAKQDLSTIADMKHDINTFVLTKMGKGPKEWQDDLKTTLVGAMPSSGSMEVTVNGKVQQMSAADLKTLTSEGDVTPNTAQVFRVSASNSFRNPHPLDPNSKLGSYVTVNSAEIKTKDGRTIVIKDNPVANAVEQHAKDLNAGKAQFTKDYFDHYSQSMQGITTTDSKLNESQKQTIMAASRKIYNGSDKEIIPATEDEQNLQAQISAGHFTHLSRLIETQEGGNAYHEISVQDPNDKTKAPQTLRVAINTDDKQLSDNVLKQSRDAEGNVTNPTLYEAGLAIRDGSSYNKINKLKGTGIVKVEKAKMDSKGNLILNTQGKPTYEEFGSVDKGPSRGVPITSITRKKGGQNVTETLPQGRIATYLQHYETELDHKTNLPVYKVSYKN